MNFLVAVLRLQYSGFQILCHIHVYIKVAFLTSLFLPSGVRDEKQTASKCHNLPFSFLQSKESVQEHEHITQNEMQVNSQKY
jgi:hypothetical protein